MPAAERIPGPSPWALRWRWFASALAFVVLAATLWFVPVRAARRAESAEQSQVSVKVARARLARASTAIDAHRRQSGVAAPGPAVTSARAELATLQSQRDRAVASRQTDRAALEQDVANAQQRLFDLEAVAVRRAELEAEEHRAANVVHVVTSQPGAPETDGGWRRGIAVAALLIAAIFFLVGTLAGWRVERAKEKAAPERRNMTPPPSGDGQMSEEDPVLDLTTIGERLKSLAPSNGEPVLGESRGAEQSG